MATEAQHVAVANRNQRTLAYLCQDVESHAAWVVTVAFYKALHIVEAIFANDDAVRGTHDHETRERILKTTRGYEYINKHYAPLARCASIARYLTVDEFNNHMPAAAIEGMIVRHYLRQIEKAADSRLKAPANLQRSSGN